MMRTFRAHTKWVFWILSISFVGWLALAQVTDILGPSQNVVLEIDGNEIQAQEFQRAVSQASAQYREETGRAPETLEDQRQLENQVASQLIQNVLLRREYKRLGLTATDEEVVAAARTAPPPEFLQQPQFQTDGQPDLGKWQAFLATTTDRQFLTWLDERYRSQIPQLKLGQYLTADLYASDAELWRDYRDEHDSVRVAVLAVGPAQIPDSVVHVSDAELERYLKAHEDQFQRPAVAHLSYLALDRRTNAADSTAALARAREIRARAASSAEAFAEVAKAESADSASAGAGGSLGWVRLHEPGFEEGFLAGLRRLRPGQVSEPVLSGAGYHIIRVAEARGDSVRASHILVPIELTGDHLDAVESRADTVDRITSFVTDPRALDSAAATLGVPVARARLVEGDRFTLGRFVIPDVSVWAFQTGVRELSHVVEGQVAYYVFRLDSLTPSGIPPLADAREAVARAVRLQKKEDLAATRARELAPTVLTERTLAATAAARGLSVQTYGPFARVTPPAALTVEPLLLGTAFGLDVGQKAGPIVGERGAYFVELLSRTTADSSAWRAQLDQQRAQALGPARQARLTAYVAGLRAKADIVDRRSELARRAASASMPQVF